MGPTQGLQERMSPASTAWDETPMFAVSKYAQQEREKEAVQEEQRGNGYRYKHNAERRGRVFQEQRNRSLKRTLVQITFKESKDDLTKTLPK